jgi:hypothetical protein
MRLSRALLLGEAWAALMATRLMMALPYRVWRGLLMEMMAERGDSPLSDGTRSVVWAVAQARRAAPGTTCLTRALAAGWMLRRRGQRARLAIGARTAEGKLEAHAWLELGGAVIIGGEADVGRYVRLGGVGHVERVQFR